MGNGMTVKKIVSSFIGQARRDPANAARIYRRGAQTLSGLANDPRNERLRPVLVNAGLSFAGAAMEAEAKTAAPQQRITQTDFSALLEEMRDAVEQLPDEGFYPGAAMDVLALRGEGGTAPGAAGAPGVPGAATPDGNPGISIAPASFNENSTLGRSVSIKFAPTDADRAQGVFESQTVAFWQGTKREAQAMSVDLTTVLVPQPNNLLTQTARAHAILEYGSDGNKQSNAVVDFGTGRRITVVGNYISVIVGMDPPRAGTTSGTLTLGASIGAFAAPSEAPVTRTVYFDDVTPGMGSNDVQQVPLRATLLLPPITQFAPNDDTVVLFLGFGGTQVGQWEFNNATGPSSPAPVPADAFFVQIFNSKGGGDIRLPFQLSL
jgi:hypothetical protein